MNTYILYGKVNFLDSSGFAAFSQINAGIGNFSQRLVVGGAQLKRRGGVSQVDGSYIFIA